MAANTFNLVGCRPKQLMPAILGYDAAAAATDIYSSDIGRLVMASSNGITLMTGGSSFSTSLIAGIVSQVPTATTSGSTIPFYVQKLDPNQLVEGTYSTLYSTVHPGTSDLGKYVGLSTAATVAGAVFSMGNMGNAPGTSDARWLKLTDFSTNRRKLMGFPAVNSSCISW
jgi:hypothetical protein